jgi:nucleolar protein 16
MPSGIRKRAAKKAGRDLHVNKRELARKRAARKERQLRRALAANPVVAASWNPKETLAQNYRRLGLRAKLNGVAGGQERDFAAGNVQAREKDEKTVRDPLFIANGGHVGALATKKEAPGANEARIERDADGNVVRIVYGKTRAYDDSDDDEEFSGFADSAADENKTEVVKELERLASLPVVSTPRVQSTREQDWISDLVAKYGDDFDAMVRDRKLNVFQQTAGDLRRRVKKWKKDNNIV